MSHLILVPTEFHEAHSYCGYTCTIEVYSYEIGRNCRYQSDARSAADVISLVSRRHVSRKKDLRYHTTLIVFPSGVVLAKPIEPPVLFYVHAISSAEIRELFTQILGRRSCCLKQRAQARDVRADGLVAFQSHDATSLSHVDQMWPVSRLLLG